MHCLEDYKEIVGVKVIGDIHKKASKLYGKHVLHINSTYQGGGVAEILNSLVPLMNDVGLDAGWRILHGNPDFFSITKKFHNALQGEPVHFTAMKEQLYMQANEDFSSFTHIDHDCVIVHDPQPLPLIKYYKKRQPWIWRCHVDLSNPDDQIWEYLTTFILRYDALILSNEKYRKDDLPVDQRIIYPAIDPLTLKNVDIPDKGAIQYLKKFGVEVDKPIVIQISRYDKWKDPEGVTRVFELVKKKVDCRLLLCGNVATDDPEGHGICEKVKEAAKDLIKRGDVILMTDPVCSNHFFINALQRISSVIVQKSIREGFCLAVTEALWKETPVVASNIGGIPLQIKDGENGFLVEPNDDQGFADRIVKILQNPGLATELGKKAKEVVRERFLITRLLSDYLDLLKDVIK